MNWRDVFRLEWWAMQCERNIRGLGIAALALCVIGCLLAVLAVLLPGCIAVQYAPQIGIP
jgi:hypothetical protein